MAGDAHIAINRLARDYDLNPGFAWKNGVEASDSVIRAADDNFDTHVTTSELAKRIEAIKANMQRGNYTGPLPEMQARRESWALRVSQQALRNLEAHDKATRLQREGRGLKRLFQRLRPSSNRWATVGATLIGAPAAYLAYMLAPVNPVAAAALAVGGILAGTLLGATTRVLSAIGGYVVERLGERRAFKPE